MYACLSFSFSFLLPLPSSFSIFFFLFFSPFPNPHPPSPSPFILLPTRGMRAHKKAIPIVNVSYTAHYNGPRYYQELKNRSIPRFTTVVTAAMIISAAAYTSTAVAGYLTFGACTVRPKTKQKLTNTIYGQ